MGGTKQKKIKVKVVPKFQVPNIETEGLFFVLLCMFQPSLESI